MKTFIIFSVMIFGISAAADSSQRVLSCEMVDLMTQRTVDRAAAEVGGGEPVSLLLSFRGLSGSVVDTPTDEANVRRLTLRMEYKTRMGSGHSLGSVDYNVAGELLEAPLAEIDLAEPTWQRTVALRCFLREEQEASVNATVTYEQGTGYSSGFCRADSDWFCRDDVKRRAREDATRDAKFRCDMRRGRADTLFPSCMDSCNPFSPPPNQDNYYLSCNANCTIRCEIEN